MEKTKNKKTYNLTEGPILNKLLLVALPIMGTQLMTMFYNLTDMFWLGRVGSTAVAASGTAGMFLWLSQAFLMVGRMGSEIGVSQSMGRGNADEARSFAHNSLFLSVVLGLGFMLGLLAFGQPLLGLFNIQEQAMADASWVYLAIAAVGIPATFVSGSIGGAFTGAGNSRVPFYINSIGLVLNMVLDPLLIIAFKLGIAGAAVATILAQYIVALLFVWALRWGRGRPFGAFRFWVKPHAAHCRQIFRWSLPIAVESLLFTLLSMIITRVINAFGTDAVAVQRVSGQIESLSWLVGGGFASAVTTFVGQNFGAEKWGRIRNGLRVSTLCMLGYGVLVTLVLLFGGGLLTGLFLPNEGLQALGATNLRILAACQILACLEYNSAGVFRGIGRTMPPSIVTTGGNLLRIPLVLALGHVYGLVGVWWGISLGACIRSIWMIGWFLVMVKRLPRYDKGVVE